MRRKIRPKTKDKEAIRQRKRERKKERGTAQFNITYDSSRRRQAERKYKEWLKDQAKSLQN